MISPARVAAYEMLSAVTSGRADLPAAIADLRATLRDDRDQALAADIATGVQRRRGTLDHLIEQFARRPVGRLDPEIVEVLRLSAYQLLYLTRVPASAVVDDAVNLARRVGKASASGLVNAVLRALSRRRSSLPLPPRPADEHDREAALDYLSVSLSHPRWLAERWLDRLGLARTERWMTFNNTAAPLTLRLNRLRTSAPELVATLNANGVRVRRGRFAPDAWIVESGQPLRGPGRDAGGFLVQDEASQLVPLLAGPDPGALVLDACASPGGKTTELAQAGSGRVVACDVRARRMALLRRTVTTAGAERVFLVQATLLSPLPFRDVFDTVLVDAPCSGLGTLRRDPDIRWRRRQADVRQLANVELRMLHHAAETVRPGGRLVYSTCSSEPEENEDVVAAFLRAAPAFSAVDAHAAHPDLSDSVVDAHGHLRTTPDEHGLEGFFGAVLQRQQ
jgi:16S rRNA (cytosine967-C5)-methyltransferase